jgi:hypothetical protein
MQTTITGDQMLTKPQGRAQPVGRQRVHLRTGLDRTFHDAVHQVRFLWWQFLRHIDVCTQELCNALRRIEHRLSKNVEQDGVDLGTAFLVSSDGHLVPDTRTLARIASTREMLAKTPWAGQMDIAVFLLGWDAAEKVSHGSPCTRRSEQE